MELRFSKTALRKIAELALEKKTGARGLRRIMVNLIQIMERNQDRDTDVNHRKRCCWIPCMIHPHRVLNKS